MYASQVMEAERTVSKNYVLAIVGANKIYKVKYRINKNKFSLIA